MQVADSSEVLEDDEVDECHPNHKENKIKVDLAACNFVQDTVFVDCLEEMISDGVSYFAIIQLNMYL